MTSKQMKARNEAFQLLSIARRILDDAALPEYCAQIAAITDAMAAQSAAINAKELARRTGARA